MPLEIWQFLLVHVWLWPQSEMHNTCWWLFSPLIRTKKYYKPIDISNMLLLTHGRFIYGPNMFDFCQKSHCRASCLQSAISLFQFCPSVCPSMAGAVSKRMDLSSHFWRSGRGIILVWALPPLQKSKPQAGASNVQGWENLANIPIYLENGTRQAQLTMEH